MPQQVRAEIVPANANLRLSMFALLVVTTGLVSGKHIFRMVTRVNGGNRSISVTGRRPGILITGHSAGIVVTSTKRAV